MNGRVVSLSHAVISCGVVSLVMMFVFLAVVSGTGAEARLNSHRLDSLEAWRSVIPDGTGIDRWRGSTMKAYMEDWKRRNPGHDVPDVDDFRHR